MEGGVTEQAAATARMVSACASPDSVSSCDAAARMSCRNRAPSPLRLRCLCQACAAVLARASAIMCSGMAELVGGAGLLEEPGAPDAARTAWRVLLATSALHACNDAFFYVLYPLLPFIAAELGLSYTEVGLVNAAFAGS